MNSKSKLSYKNRFAKLVFSKIMQLFVFPNSKSTTTLHLTPHLTAPNTDYRLKKRRRLFPCWATGERSRANTDYGQMMSKFQIIYDQNLKSDNLQYNTLGRWDERLIDQASDVPSIIFFHNFL